MSTIIPAKTAFNYSSIHPYGSVKPVSQWDGGSVGSSVEPASERRTLKRLESSSSHIRSSNRAGQRSAPSIERKDEVRGSILMGIFVGIGIVIGMVGGMEASADNQEPAIITNHMVGSATY